MRSAVKFYCCCFFLIVPWTGHFITICPCSIIATGCCYKYKTRIIIPTAERRQGTCLATIIIITPSCFRNHSVHHLPFVNLILAGSPFAVRPLFLSALHSPAFLLCIRCGSTIPLRHLSTVSALFPCVRSGHNRRFLSPGAPRDPVSQKESAKFTAS